ncbi:PhnJ-domain-containing protein, partial [Rhizophagus irregularis]
SFGYAGLRGYGSSHPNVGEVRVGYQPIHIQIDDEDEYYIGSIKLTEVESFIPANVSENGKEVLEFDIGYGACFGQNETKAIAMSILDHALENPENTPIHDEEFVLLHIDTVESTGFISHLKLPHYVTFQSKLEQIRKIKREDEQSKKEIRRAVLKGVAIPGYQVPFASREMPIGRGWGTGGLQITLSLIGESDVLKVIDQGSDESVNAVNIKKLVQKTT